MRYELDQIEERVLGCLIEKGITTPDYYPLTLNSLTAACNQKSNRDPVLEVDDKVVVRALDSLREKELARVVSGAEIRVPKYYHRFAESEDLSPPQLAVLCELMLRGPQTVGELRGRASRMVEFADLASVETVLLELASREADHKSGPAVRQLPRQPGRKESRYAHLFAGEPALTAEESAHTQGPAPEPARLIVQAENERIEGLESAVQELRDEVAEMRSQLDSFKQQFE
jgi:uncharacterized protein YceH (UPF0502 family)